LGDFLLQRLSRFSSAPWVEIPLPLSLSGPPVNVPLPLPLPLPLGPPPAGPPPIAPPTFLCTWPAPPSHRIYPDLDVPTIISDDGPWIVDYPPWWRPWKPLRPFLPRPPCGPCGKPTPPSSSPAPSPTPPAGGTEAPAPSGKSHTVVVFRSISISEVLPQRHDRWNDCEVIEEKNVSLPLTSCKPTRNRIRL